jgi:hypothetical protein
MPQPFLGPFPSEPSPRRDRAPLSRPLASLQSSTRVQDRASRGLVTGGFTDARAHARWPGSPADYGLPFGAPKRASRSPWTTTDGLAPYRRLHLLRSFLPPADPFTSTGVAPTRRPLLSWAFAPPEPSPPTSRILGPARACARTPTPPAGFVARPKGPLDPSSQVSPPRNVEHRDELVGSFQPPSGPARAASRRRSSSLGLGAPGAPGDLTLGVSEYVRSGVPPRRSPALLGFPTSSSASQLWNALDPGLSFC